MLRGVSTNLYQISCSPLLFNAFICGRDGERGVLKPFSDMDYCNVALAGLPSCAGLVDCVQSVINAAARLTVGAQRHDHITPLLGDLHWLRMPQRIQYKLLMCVLVAYTGPHRATYRTPSAPVASAE